MTVVYDRESERHSDGDRKPESRCASCWGPLDYPYAVWTTGHETRDGYPETCSTFFCHECCGTALANDFAQLRRCKEIKRHRRELEAMDVGMMVPQ
jgi:hypothetical protein